MNSLRPCPHKSGNFETAYFLLPTLVWIGCLKPFWRAVLKDVVLVSERSINVEKNIICGSKNICINVDL